MKASKKKIFRSVESIFDHYIGKTKIERSEESLRGWPNGIHIAEELIKRFKKCMSQPRQERTQ
jgi:hypothetical protein